MRFIVLGKREDAILRTRPGTAAQALVKLRRWRDSGMRVKVVETETGRPIDDLELEGLASRQTSDSAALRA